MENHNDTQTGIISWFARNSVAANLLMIFIIIMGIASYFTIQRQMFPNIEINYITVDQLPWRYLKRLKVFSLKLRKQ